jgi:hypothetical protein
MSGSGPPWVRPWIHVLGEMARVEYLYVRIIIVCRIRSVLSAYKCFDTTIKRHLSYRELAKLKQNRGRKLS